MSLASHTTTKPRVPFWKRTGGFFQIAFSLLCLTNAALWPFGAVGLVAGWGMARGRLWGLCLTAALNVVPPLVLLQPDLVLERLTANAPNPIQIAPAEGGSFVQALADIFVQAHLVVLQTLGAVLGMLVMVCLWAVCLVLWLIVVVVHFAFGKLHGTTKPALA